jgi:lipoprotein-anchoring transpeptidase ErfK/SrfK
MEKPFNQEQPVDPNLEELSQDPNASQETPVSPAQPVENDTTNISRRNFLTGLTAFAMGGMSSSLKAEAPKKTAEVPKSPETLERENKLLQKIGLERSQVKPEYLNKYFEGAYKALVIINIDPEKQRLNAYDKDGNFISVKDKSGNTITLKDVKISSGRGGMETPIASNESGSREKIRINHDDVDMPYAVAIDQKEGLWIHQGTRPGFPASHGCIRLDEEYAEEIFNLAKKPKDLLFVTIAIK